MFAIFKKKSKKTRSELSETAIRAYLGEYAEQLDISLFDTIDSTNAEARRTISRGVDIGRSLLICAEAQSAGRGRLGRSFYSPAASGIYMTLAFSQSPELATAVGLTTAASVAVCRAIERVLGITNTGIKWVNDIYLSGKKVAGILAESCPAADGTGAPYIILGIGINLATEDFPKELHGIAASLGRDLSERNALIAAILCNLFDIMKGAEYIHEYRRRSLVLGKDIIFTERGVTHNGHVLDILDSGALSVLTPDGEQLTLNSGEISVRVN